MSGPFWGVRGGRVGVVCRRVSLCGRCKAGTEQAHGVDQQLPENGQRFGRKVSSAAVEPDLHGGLAAGDDGTGKSPEIQLNHLVGRMVDRPLAGGGDDLLGAVVPGLEF